LLPWLSRLSVRRGPARRFRHRCSFRYLRISPLHRKFRTPLPPSRSTVSKALPRLSRGLSPQTWRPAYAPFKPSDSEQRSHGSSYRGCWHELSPCFLRRSIKGCPFSPSRQCFTTRRPSSHTRRRSVRLAPIAEDPRLQPPVGVWPVSQCQWRRSCSHTC
jgi:hypothetical protein